MKNTLFICLLFAFSLVSLNFSSPQSLSKRTLTYLSDDFTLAILKAKKDFTNAQNLNNKDSLLKVRGEFERILQLKKNEWLVDYYLAQVDFILSNTAMNTNNNDDIKKYTESSLKLLEKSIELKDDFSESYILKLAVESNRFMYEMDKMNDIFAQQSDAKTNAEKIEPDNPRLYLIEGMNTFYTPEQFGGGADKSLPLFQKSYELFRNRKEVDETYPNWGTDMAPGMVAMCYIKQNKLDDAKTYIDKALQQNPNSGFIMNYVQKEYDKANVK